MKKEQRIKKARRYIDEYFHEERTNPRICLTEEEAQHLRAELLSSYDRFYLVRGNMVSYTHTPPLFMWKILV